MNSNNVKGSSVVSIRNSTPKRPLLPSDTDQVNIKKDTVAHENKGNVNINVEVTSPPAVISLEQ